MELELKPELTRFDDDDDDDDDDDEGPRFSYDFLEERDGGRAEETLDDTNDEDVEDEDEEGVKEEDAENLLDVRIAE